MIEEKKKWKPVYYEQRMKMQRIIELFNKKIPVIKIADIMGMTASRVYRYIEAAGLHCEGAKRDPKTGRFVKSED